MIVKFPEVFHHITHYQVGFDRIFDRLQSLQDRVQQNSTQYGNYPPFNLVEIEKDLYNIEIAVAGFSENDLDIKLQDGKLTITGSITNKKDTYLYQGIAARNFTREFDLADTVTVEGADLVNGLLVITLRNVIPKEKLPKKIPIGCSQKSKTELLLD